MKRENSIENFSYTLESDALLDIFSTAGTDSEINQDSFEVLTNKNLTVLILADGKGEGKNGEIVSGMASKRALEFLDEYQFDKKSHEEIVQFLKNLFLDTNDFIVEHIEKESLEESSTTLSVAVIYKNSFYTAHIGESRIYVIHRDDTPTLLSKDPSYNKKISKDTLHAEDKSYYLGDNAFSLSKIFVTHEANLFHKDRVLICSQNILDTLPEKRFVSDVEEIDTLLENNFPSANATFLRYLHYERSVKVLRVEQEEVVVEDEKMEIDWEKLKPLLKKIALGLGSFFVLGFVYLMFTQEPEEMHLKESTSNEKVEALSLDNKKSEVKYEAFREAPTELNAESEIGQKNFFPMKEPKSEAKQMLGSSSVESPTISREEERRTEPVKERKESSSVVSFGEEPLKLLTKADSEILYIGTEGIRITFKENKLVASQKDFFSMKNGNKHRLYAVLNGVSSSLSGDITNQLKKQYFAEKVYVSTGHNRVRIDIQVKSFCSYKRSAWAKKSGLDLLTFTCE